MFLTLLIVGDLVLEQMQIQKQAQEQKLAQLQQQIQEQEQAHLQKKTEDRLPAQLQDENQEQIHSQSRKETDFNSCKECHLKNGKYKNSKNKKGTTHSELKLEHMKRINNCQICHSKNDVTKLKLITGEGIENDKTPNQCGQCHGIVKRDWDAGIHGKKVKGWGEKGELWSCIRCHDPHAPKFPQYTAVKPPRRPLLGIEKKGNNHE